MKNNFTKEEISIAKQTRGVIIDGESTRLKAVYMAGEICMWDELQQDKQSQSDQQSEWVSVDERLPEEMKDILFCNIEVESLSIKTVSLGWRNKEGFYSYASQGKNRLPVTHWQPLPPPPSYTPNI